MLTENFGGFLQLKQTEQCFYSLTELQHFHFSG